VGVKLDEARDFVVAGWGKVYQGEGVSDSSIVSLRWDAYILDRFSAGLSFFCEED
jgi:hypothetical protein